MEKTLSVLFPNCPPSLELPVMMVQTPVPPEIGVPDFDREHAVGVVYYSLIDVPRLSGHQPVRSAKGQPGS
jgi:hypothetical protein